VRVAVYHNNADVRVEDRPRPLIGDGELLLRIEASGICGSDLMEWYRVPRAPLILGHEVAGVVEEVGAGVERFKPGDRVVATHHVPCETCRYCRTGRQSSCETLHGTSFDPGGFCEWVRLSPIHVERGTFALPDNVSFDEGSFVEPLACVIRAQRLAGLSEGDTVAVLGAGVSGILQIQVARDSEASRIVATDLSDFRLDLARRLGADAVMRADEPDLLEQLLEANDGRRYERVLVCTAARPAIEQALRLADDGGSVLLFAPLPPDATMELPMNDLWRRCVNLIHSYAGPPAEMRSALAMIANGRIALNEMITHRLPLDRTQEGFRLMTESGESLKVIVEPQR
jgi:L-iditol 2-dehydrogenase